MNECHVKKIIVDNQSLETLSINRGFISQERTTLHSQTTYSSQVIYEVFMQVSRY